MSIRPIADTLRQLGAGAVFTVPEELIRPDQVFEQAVKTELAKIGDTTRLTILFGSPSI